MNKQLDEQGGAAEARTDEGPGNFIREIVQEELNQGMHGGRVVTRFPPEPNGYLHIGHAKSICLNFGIAALSDKGQCNLRFDDTNPEVEDVEFVDAIRNDIKWLGFDWGEHEYYASNYYEQLYELALRLIEKGKAYVDSQSLDQIREGRGSFYKDGIESPHRSRGVEENLNLFKRMRAGEFADGSHVLRAKIDMQSKDIKLRDPLMYRIRHAHHHRTGDAWCIYPMYDWAHGQSDAIEGVTHSVCSLEFQNHRPLYDWFVSELGFADPPRQIEFARLNLTHTVMSKRKLAQLVKDGVVSGWDDPRMPTLAGMRRRGFTPEAIRTFCDRIGVARRDNIVEVELLEHAVREDLNARCPRVMAVLNPLRVVITNWPEGETREATAPYHPEDESYGARAVPMSRVIYVERDDFMEEPMKKWFRLAPGREVRLRYAAIIKCNEVVKDANGEITELRCTWDETSWGGTPADGRKIRGTLHWVSAEHARDAEVRLYDRLFATEQPGDDEESGSTFLDHINPTSIEVLPNAKLEPSLASATPGHRVQFERLGYFCFDPAGTAEAPVVNRTIALRDSWAKIANKRG